MSQVTKVSAMNNTQGKKRARRTIYVPLSIEEPIPSPATSEYGDDDTSDDISLTDYSNSQYSQQDVCETLDANEEAELPECPQVLPEIRLLGREHKPMEYLYVDFTETSESDAELADDEKEYVPHGVGGKAKGKTEDAQCNYRGDRKKLLKARKTHWLKTKTLRVKRGRATKGLLWEY